MEKIDNLFKIAAAEALSVQEEDQRKLCRVTSLALLRYIDPEIIASGYNSVV